MKLAPELLNGKPSKIIDSVVDQRYPFLTRKHIYLFNEAGLLSVKHSYDSTGTLTDHWELVNDPSLKKPVSWSAKSTFPGGGFDNTYLFSYDKKGVLFRLVHHSGDSGTISIFRNSNAGYPVEMKTTTLKGKLKEWQIAEYYPEKNAMVVREISGDSISAYGYTLKIDMKKPSPWVNSIEKMDKWGNTVYFKTVPNNGRFNEEESEFTYDSRGNWIVCTSWQIKYNKSGKKERVLIRYHSRQITYLD